MGDQVNEEGRFGLAIPGLKTGEGAKKFWNALLANDLLIKKVREFLESNGLNASKIYEAIGTITYSKDPQARIGIRIWGTDELAQKLADAFPQQTVITDDGKIISPSQVAAPKAARTQSGPHR
jgi:hypothetical protein